jgi:hypothetical protein
MDAALKENVLDLWSSVHELIDQSGEMNSFDFWQLVPDHFKASCEELALTDRLQKEYQVVPSRVINNQILSLQLKQEEAITRLYLAICFVLGLRLSGASEEKIKSLMITYSFGLSEPQNSQSAT